jgi:trimeric autotransporter adhesin
MSGSYMPSLYPGEMELGVGVGGFQGYGAIAVTFKALSGTGRWSWGAGVSTTGNQYGVNAGVGWKW